MYLDFFILPSKVILLVETVSEIPSDDTGSLASMSAVTNVTGLKTTGLDECATPKEGPPNGNNGNNGGVAV